MKYNNVQSLFEGLEDSSLQKKIFAQFGDSKITYKKLLEDVNRLCYYFHQKGLEKQDHVILSTKDDYFTSLFFLAFLRYGIVSILLDPEVPQKRALALMEKADAKGLVMDDDLFEERNVPKDAFSFTLRIKKDTQKKGRLFKRLMKNKKGDEPQATSFPAIINDLSSNAVSLSSSQSDDLAYILFTSGTTSEPKGVMISHGNLFAQLSTLSNVYELDDYARLHNIMMMYHVDGIIQGPVLALYNRAIWVRPMRFDLSKINDVFHSIYKYRATHFFCVPLILSFMEKYSEGYEDSFQTDDFKYVISSASKLEHKLWQDFEQKFKVPVFNVYGMTETVAAALYCTRDEKRKVGTIGVPVDCEAKIAYADGSDVPNGNEGVLWIKGSNIFKGYFNNPSSTQEALKDGWLNTGDVAVKDDDGFFTITGRVRNMINTGGVNIYPEQVSEMVSTHPSIIENVCLGVEDENIGEKLVCVAALKPGSQLDKMELLDFLRPLIKQNQLPKEVVFLEALPKGISGKVEINEVRKLISNSSELPQSTSTSNHQHVVIEVASEVFGIAANNLNMQDTAQSIDGWDSMAHLAFITGLEKRFDLRFSTSEMMTMTSLNTAHRILSQKLESR